MPTGAAIPFPAQIFDSLRVATTIEGTAVIIDHNGDILWWAGAMIDVDGLGPAHGDPDYQRRTTLLYNGRYLNADEDPYIVTPPAVEALVAPKVLGCQAEMLNTRTGLWTPGVVGDTGPRKKLGEMSALSARLIGVPPSPTTGGVSDHIIFYRIRPGIPAIARGKTYQLQSAVIA